MSCSGRRLAASLWACFCVGSAYAQTSPLDVDFTDNYVLKPVPLSMGGAFRALADTNAAILLNPAGIALRKGIVSVGGDYLYSGYTEANTFDVSIVDFKTLGFLALGLEYDFNKFKAVGSDVTANQITLTGAVPFADIVYVGLGVKYYFSSIDTPLISTPDAADVDMGLLVRPIPMVSFALTGHNLIQGYKFPEYPLTMGFGAALNLQPHARIAIDMTKDFASPAAQTLNAYFGADLRLVEGYHLRGGFGLDNVRNNNFWSVGFNAAGPKAGFTFVFSQRLSPTQETYGANVEVYF